MRKSSQQVEINNTDSSDSIQEIGCEFKGIKRVFINFLLVVSIGIGKSTAGEVILTGQIKAGDVQNFTVPWSPNWRHQIKWMKPEGEIVEKDELVVLFDTANLDSMIEQQQATLRQTEEKSKDSQLSLEQKIIEAEHALVKAELEFKLAELAISVPSQFRSDFERDNLDFDYKKAKTLLSQAREKLQTEKAALAADQQKQALEIARLSAVLTKQQNELEQLQLRSQRRGTVLHAMHPWDGTKISEGQQVQTTWNVASIPGIGDESVVAWVNEVDWHFIQVGQFVRLTLDAYPNIVFEGRVKKIGQQAESKLEWGSATYYAVNIEITELPKAQLFPGMSVRVEVSKSDSPSIGMNTKDNQ